MGKTKPSPRMGKLTATLSAVLAVSLVAAPAAATVYEIGNDGIVRIAGTDSSATGNAGTVASASATPEAAPDVPPVAITTIAEPTVPPDYRQSLLSASNRYDVSPRLLAALTRQESAWRPSVVSSKGAIGLTQLMPATARAMAVDPRDPSANLAGGARYLRQLLDLFDGNIERALAAYNAGPGRVVRATGIPAFPETRAYVTSIVDRLGVAAVGDGRR